MVVRKLLYLQVNNKDRKVCEYLRLADTNQAVCIRRSFLLGIRAVAPTVLTLDDQREGTSRLEIKLVVIELPTDALALQTVKR